MRVYVAFRTDVDPPKRLASGSFNRLRRRLRKLPKGSEFTVATYSVKPDLETVCQAIEDVTQLGADEVVDYFVNEQRQLRKVRAL